MQKSARGPGRFPFVISNTHAYESLVFPKAPWSDLCLNSTCFAAEEQEILQPNVSLWEGDFCALLPTLPQLSLNKKDN